MEDEWVDQVGACVCFLMELHTPQQTQSTDHTASLQTDEVKVHHLFSSADTFPEKVGNQLTPHCTQAEV